MKLGLYEQLINHITRKQLDSLDTRLFAFGTEPLDPEEARKQLSTYLATVTRRALKMIREQSSDDNDAILSQVKVCNEIIDILKNTLGPSEATDWQLDEQGEILTYVHSKLNHIRGVQQEKVIRPITPYRKAPCLRVLIRSRI